MRGNKYSLLLLVSLIVIPVGFAAAANSQGLSWGVSIGDEFMFNVVYESNIDYSTPYNEDVVITITNLPTLPDTISSTGGFYVFYDTEFVNGTDTIVSIMGPIAYPVGNWGVFSGILAEAIADAGEGTMYESFEGSVIDSLSIWGYTLSYSYSDSSMTATIHYSKADGVLNYLQAHTEYTSSNEFVTYSITREGYFGGMLGFDPMIAIIGVIGVIAVIVIIVIIKR